MIHAPIVLRENAVFLADIGKIAGLRANLVIVHAACQKFGNFIAGEVDLSTVDPEVAFAFLRIVERHLTAQEGSAEFEGVVAAHVVHRIGYLIGVLRNRIQAIVAGVFEVAFPSANQCTAGGFLIDVGVHDAQILRHIHAVHRRHVAVVIAVIADTCLIHQARRKDVRVAQVPAARMGGVGAGCKACRKLSELRSLGHDRIVVAHADKRHIAGGGVPVQLDVEGVVFVDYRLVVEVIVQIAIRAGRRRERIEIIDRGRIQTCGRNDIAREGLTGGGIVDEARAGRTGLGITARILGLVLRGCLPGHILV